MRFSTFFLCLVIGKLNLAQLKCIYCIDARNQIMFYHMLCVLLNFLVIISFLNETEARRKVLRGRKTITRTYYSK